MRQKITEVRQRLGDALRGQFRNEIARSSSRIRDSIAPHSRFVRSEGEKLKELEMELNAIASELQSLRAGVERLGA